MLAHDVLNELASRGVELRAAGNRLLFRPREAVTPDLQAEMNSHKHELLELLSLRDDEIDWRVAVMRPQVPVRGPIPFLIARPATPDRGGCLSCGDELTSLRRIRCGACVTAAHRVLYEIRESMLDAGNADEIKDGRD